jgi:polyphenol oxidase
MWLQSPNIACLHGFSTRYGGVSKVPFNALNLGGSDDGEQHIFQNREIALKHFNLTTDTLCYLKQVHGSLVCQAKIGQQEGGALVSNELGKILAVSMADCYPLLFYDQINKVIGAAHAGWRGTVSRIAANTVAEMVKLGAKTESIQVAIGQGISQANFEVGKEVIEQFERANFPKNCWTDNKIDLVKCNKFVLLQNKILEQNIWSMNRCTFEEDFFSYRRDKSLTGRMWGIISMA